MAEEIERRFLVKAENQDKIPFWQLPPRTILDIYQGYFDIPFEMISLRIRITNNKDGVLTLKRGRGMLREEINSPIASNETAWLLFESSSFQLFKRRYVIDGWEIDKFKADLKGIVIAEKEFKSLEEAEKKLILPPWLEGAIEVTNNLTNLHLARISTVLYGRPIPEVISVLGAYASAKIPKIVITGPPASGKSGIIKELTGQMPDVQFVPETASIVLSQLNINPGTAAVSQRQFQQTIYKVQNVFEATSAQFAIGSGKKAVVFDRGTVDGAAYLLGTIQEFEKLNRVKIQYEYEKYDMVIFLDLPSKEIYEKCRYNNPARSEDYDKAAFLRDELHNVWVAHPNLVFVESNDNWQTKVDQAAAAIKSLIEKSTKCWGLQG